MRKTDIERVIKQGSIKQKIKLYFTDIAYFNTVGIKTAQIKGSGDTATLDRPEKILTDRERDIIFNSIKEPKDIKYYEELRTWNKAFLMFKPTITTYVKNFDLLTSQLSKYTVVRILHKSYEDAINDILEVVEEKKLRETLVKTALESLKQFDAKKYQEKGFLPFIEIPEANINGKVWLLVEVLNEKIKEAKEYIKGIETFLNKQLPLQPYKQFLREEEDKIKANIQECRTLIEAFTLGRTVENDLDKVIEVKTEEELQDEERYKILNWDEVEVEVTDEDIEDIKRAGI
jgi:hypothetical protein